MKPKGLKQALFKFTDILEEKQLRHIDPQPRLNSAQLDPVGYKFFSETDSGVFIIGLLHQFDVVIWHRLVSQPNITNGVLLIGEPNDIENISKQVSTIDELEDMWGKPIVTEKHKAVIPYFYQNVQYWQEMIELLGIRLRDALIECQIPLSELSLLKIKINGTNIGDFVLTLTEKQKQMNSKEAVSISKGLIIQ